MTLPTNSGPSCLHAWESMPWVLQNSAPREQAEWLQDHVAHCESCRAEFAQQRRLHSALSLPSKVKVDANAGFERLLARIDVSEADASSPPVGSMGWPMRALIAAVLVQAIGIGMLGAKLWNAGNDAAYHTLSRESAPVVAGMIRLLPDASMTMAEWNALLHVQHLKIIDGPNDLGAYAVVPTAAAFASPNTLEQLRATQRIRLAEPIAAQQ